jgi:hypothetical protein
LGHKLSGFGWTATWNHSSRNWSWLLSHNDFATGFRDDQGFVPQVGYRNETANLSYRFFTDGFFSRLRPAMGVGYTTARDGSLLSRSYAPALNLQGRWNLRGSVTYSFDALRIDGRLLEFNHLLWSLSASPSRLLPSVTLSGDYGEQADVENVRVGTGGTVGLMALVRPTDHLGLDLRAERRWIDETVNGMSGRLFTADVARVKATYVFNARMLVRLIGQYVETTRDPTLWTLPVPAKDGDFAGSALFSYKLNWQTVLFVGYGDNRTLQEDGVLTRADRQFFLKVSYAFQR